MNRRERNTILAALRYWQRLNDGTLMLSDLTEIAAIATDGGVSQLTSNEIDVLCEKLNGVYGPDRVFMPASGKQESQA